MSRESTEKEREYIRRRKNIQYRYAKKYFPPAPDEDTESEEHLRERVREGLQYLSTSERVEMRAEMKAAYEDVYGESWC